MAKSDKNARAARRRAARKKAAREGAAKPSRAAASGGSAAVASGSSRAAAKPSRAAAEPSRAAEKPESTDEAMSLARRVAWWALLAMVFLVPIAMSNFTFIGIEMPFTYDQFDIVKVALQRVLGLVALGAWAWDMLRHGGKLRRTPVDWLVLAFLVWVAITTITSIHWPMALFGKPRRYEGLLSFVNYAVIYFLVLQFACTAARVRMLARSLFFGSLIVAGYGALQALGVDPVRWAALPFEVNRSFSTYGNPDLLGGFLIFSVTVALGLALTETNLVWRLVYWAGFGLNGLVLITAFTRGAWIGGGLSLLLLGIVAWRHRAPLRRLDWVPAGVSAALGIGVIVRSLSSPDDVMNFGKRLASIFEFGGGSGQTRTEIWQAAIAAIKERPVLGWGADTFRLVFPRFKPVEYVRDAGGMSVADNAHDYPLHLAAGVGIPGMLLLYGVFVWAGVRSFRTVFGRSNDASRIVIGAFWAAAAGYLVQLLVGLSVTGTTFLLWAAIGVVLAPTARVVTVKAPRWGAVAAVAALCAAALGVGYQGLFILADNAYLRAEAAGDGAESIELVRRAARLQPLNGTYKEAVGLAYAARAREYLRAGAAAEQRGDDTTPYAEAFRENFANAERALKEAIAFVPSEYDSHVSLAELFVLGGQTLRSDLYQSAVQVARQGIEAAPYGTAIRVQLARALLGQGKTDEAVKELEYVVRIDPSGGRAALLLAATYQEQGKTVEALAVLRAVEALRPGQAGVAEAIEQLEAGEQPEE